MARHDGSLAPISWRAQAPNTSCQRPKATCAVEERCWRNFTVASHPKHPPSALKGTPMRKAETRSILVSQLPRCPTGALFALSEIVQIHWCAKPRTSERAGLLARFFCWLEGENRTGQRWRSLEQSMDHGTECKCWRFSNSDTGQPSSLAALAQCSDFGCSCLRSLFARVGAHWKFSNHIPLPIACLCLLAHFAVTSTALQLPAALHSPFQQWKEIKWW